MGRACPFAPPDPSAKDWPDGNRHEQSGDNEQNKSAGARRAVPVDGQQKADRHRRDGEGVVRVKQDPLSGR
jgi:hypothetical protein